MDREKQLKTRNISKTRSIWIAETVLITLFPYLIALVLQLVLIHKPDFSAFIKQGDLLLTATIIAMTTIVRAYSYRDEYKEMFFFDKRNFWMIIISMFLSAIFAVLYGAVKSNMPINYETLIYSSLISYLLSLLTSYCMVMHSVRRN